MFAADAKLVLFTSVYDKCVAELDPIVIEQQIKDITI